MIPGLKIGPLNELSGGFMRIRYNSSVKAACSGSYNFPNQFFCLAIQTKEYPKSSFCKVKVARKKGSGLYPLMSRTSYVKKRMEIETQDEEGFSDVKEGDIINLSDLIFSEDRDYLVRYNGQQVKAEELVGKAVLVYFLPVSHDLDFYQENWITYLIDIYNDLLPKNDFEVILVAVDDPSVPATPCCSPTEPYKVFESIFSRVPWTAIPFSNLASRKRIARRFGISEIGFVYSTSVLLDAKGMVLKCDYCWLFGQYGTLGFPFTDERIKFLDSEDDAAINQPSLEALLGSSERDYLITNKGDKVPIHTLKNKVVALYFYEDGLNHNGQSSLADEKLRNKLEMAYKELAKNKEQFEVVLLYLYDTCGTVNCTTEESFWKIFKTMPWLALPFKDPNHKKLIRIFGYPNMLDDGEEAPTLVILGPNGEFVDPCGADILMDFGTPTYPFTRKKLAKLETEKAKELKLEMLWDPNTIFRVNKDGLEIPLSQFFGKRLMIYFEMHKYYQHCEMLGMMKDLYLNMKGTEDEFEVIYIKDPTSYDEPDVSYLVHDYGELPWPVHYYDEGYSLPKELEHSVLNYHYYNPTMTFRRCLLIAFDRDGSIVRKTFQPTFDDKVFPFYAGGLEKEFLYQLNICFGWNYWNHLSKKKNPIYKRAQ
ncbi:putative nucleoredoxin 1 isoform X2 [Apium graveolens]